MKKHLFGIGLVAMMGFAASAQQPVALSFIGVNQSLSCSNIAQPTNILSIGVAPTNAVGIQFTNSAGVRLIADGTNYESRNPFVDLPIWPDHDGRYEGLSYSTNSALLNAWQPSPLNVYVKLVGQSGANSAVTFSFFPLADGTNECNAAGSRWDFSLTANTTTPVTLVTNVPLYLWRGCHAIRCTRVVNTDTDASSRVDLLSLELTGFKP